MRSFAPIGGFTLIDYRAPLEELPDPLPIVPLEKPFDVTITPPGSKSITNRAYVLAALADGESRIIRPLRAEDTDLLLDALCTLGAEARWEGEDVYIKGVGGRFPRGGSVYLGDGGTPTRFMIAAACLAAEPVVVDGSKRMRERPIVEGVEMLRQLGAKIEYVEEEGRLPVRVVPSESFKGGELRVGKTASSQFVSAVLLVGSQLADGVRILFTDSTTSSSYIYLTTWTMDQWLLEVEIDDEVENPVPGELQHRRFAVARQSIECGTRSVETDASSCVYWLAAAALVSGARCRVPIQPLVSLQPDRGFGLELTTLFGCDCEFLQGENGFINDTAIVGPERFVLGQPSTDGSMTPDAALMIAVVASRAESGMTITGLHTLRVKETDRLAALANELRKVGCTVETTEDSITIKPPAWKVNPDAASDDRREEDADRGAGNAVSEVTSSGPSSLRSSDPASVVIETYNDHRMAMSFAILGLVRPGISIRNPKCVAKSYPTFWKDFAKLYE